MIKIIQLKTVRKINLQFNNTMIVIVYTLTKEPYYNIFKKSNINGLDNSPISKH